MEEFIAAAVILSGVGLGNGWLILGGIILLILVLLAGFLLHAVLRRGREPKLAYQHALDRHFSRSELNPVLTPNRDHAWESEAVFNPAVVYDGGRVHLLYRALGGDGVSRIGYASSKDGVHFDERLPYPVFIPYLGDNEKAQKYKNPFAQKAPERRYNPDVFASGGGWGGSEDPRAVKIDDCIHMSFSMFESWESMRQCLTSINREDFLNHAWNWAPHYYISPEQQTHKNWVLFPEKISGKYAILHALTPSVMIEYADSLEDFRDEPIVSNNRRGGRKGHWDGFVRGASAPPIKTERGWLLFYHGMDPKRPAVGYKVGAMLLDLEDPTKVLYRSAEPVLVPTMWYENDWKPGVVYASGAIVKDGKLFLYYGGGDKTVSVATAPLHEFLDAMTTGRHAVLTDTR